MTTLSCLKENDDSRVALTPATAKQFLQQGFIVKLEKGAGEASGYPDNAYEGVTIETHLESLLSADIILTVKGCVHPTEGQILSINGEKGLRLDRLPRITRAQIMDVLSSQNNLAGYQAVLEGAYHLKRSFPMMMTAAGTVPAARVLVLGAGVAGLQAIATAKRLGAIVSAFDVRPTVKEQVESLGAVFVEVNFKESGDGVGGYAKEMSRDYQEAQNAKILEVIQTQDIVISTALIPGKPAPVLITEEMVKEMKSGSIIIDLAGESGGNCALSKWQKVITTKNNVRISCPKNILDFISHDASHLYARNLYHFIKALYNSETKSWRKDDALFQSCIVE